MTYGKQEHAAMLIIKPVSCNYLPEENVQHASV